MLKEIFSKKEISEEEKNQRLKRETLIYLAIFFIFAMFVLFNDSPKREMKAPTYEFDSVMGFDTLDKIDNNYSIEINKTADDENINLTYMQEDNIILYEGNYLDRDGYMKYNDKYYYLDDNNIYDIKDISIINKINPNYYNIKLIRNVLKECSFVHKENDDFICSLKVNNFFNKYNEIYGTNYNDINDTGFNILVTLNDNKIKKINIDYTIIDSIINNTTFNSLNYNIRINNVNENDFSTIEEYMLNKKNN